MIEKAKWRFDLRSGLFTLVAVVICALGRREWENRVAALSPATVRTVDPDLLKRLKIGMDGTVRNPLRGAINVGRTRESYEAMKNAEDANDQIVLRELVASGQGYKVSNGNGAAILDKDPLGTIKLQFTGGDHAGEFGWTSGEYFNPSGLAAPPVPGAPQEPTRSDPPLGGP